MRNHSSTQLQGCDIPGRGKSRAKALKEEEKRRVRGTERGPGG